MNKKHICFLILFLFSANSFSQSFGKEDDLRTLVTLLDYISKDYSVAVENGQVINEFEFAEMSEFAEKCILLHSELSASIESEPFHGLDSTLLQLSKSIEEKSDPGTVSELALSAKNKILGLGILKITPDRYPSIENGAVLYQNSCLSCHGKNGFGDGEAGKSLDPAPTNFHEAKMSPLGAYNVIKLGIDGTGMASYNHLTEQELWDLSFYLQSLRHSDELSKIDLPQNLLLDSISKWNDEELQHFLDESAYDIKIGQVRNHEPDRPDPLDAALKSLAISYELFGKGDNKAAEKHALASYLEGVELVENILNASSPSLVRDIERDMIAYRKAIQNNDRSGAEALFISLQDEIKSAQSVLAERDYSFSFIYGSALSILIREAMEALLIILIVLGVLKPMKIQKAVFAVHTGWVSALLIGIASWFFIDTLINLSGASRELMEGFGAILAVVVLLFAGIWLHSHSEMTKWKGFVKEKLTKISESGNWLGLFAFSFVVVFREAFEVVLFLSSLKLSNPEVAGSAINLAFISSVAIIVVITLVFVKLTHKLPIGQFFKFASYMVATLAVILAGKGITAFQEVGYLPISPVYFMPRIDLLGIYPNIQSLTAQLLVLGIILFFNWKNKNASIKKESRINS